MLKAKIVIQNFFFSLIDAFIQIIFNSFTPRNVENPRNPFFFDMFLFVQMWVL